MKQKIRLDSLFSLSADKLLVDPESDKGKVMKVPWTYKKPTMPMAKAMSELQVLINLNMNGEFMELLYTIDSEETCDHIQLEKNKTGKLPWRFICPILKNKTKILYLYYGRFISESAVKLIDFGAEADNDSKAKYSLIKLKNGIKAYAEKQQSKQIIN